MPATWSRPLPGLGPESGITSFRLTAAAITELTDSAQSSILLVSHPTQTEPPLDTALAAAGWAAEVILPAEQFEV